jgi:hypothetical protein
MLNAAHTAALHELLRTERANSLVKHLQEAQDLLVNCCVEDYGTLVSEVYYSLKLLKEFLAQIEDLPVKIE